MVDKLLASRAAGALIRPLRAYVRYAPPSARKDYLWRRVVEPHLAWRDHRFVAATAAGRLAGRTSDVLQQALYYFGTWEPAVTAFVAGRLRPCDGFVDVGANIGYFSLLAARCVGAGGHVTAVEASPAVYAELVRNVRRNRAAVRTVPAAAADRPGVLRLFDGGAGNCGASSLVAGDGAGVEVPAAPLADLLTAQEVAAARLVKIDVEGAEASVLDGLVPVADRLRPDCEFLVEVHRDLLVKAGRSAAEVFAWFAARGYHPYRIETDADATAYLWPAAAGRPLRMNGPTDWDVNVVFSRTDAEAL